MARKGKGKRKAKRERASSTGAASMERAAAVLDAGTGGAAPVRTRGYEAAMSIPSRRRVTGADGSQDAAADPALEPIREWGRYLDENHDLASGILDELVKNTVGAGIVTIPKPLRADGSVDTELGVQIMNLWRPWTRAADVTGELSWHESQRLAARAWFRDGEEFVHHVAGRAAGFPFARDDVPYRIELLESEFVPRELSNEDGWRQGVHLNQWRAPVEYGVYKQHPGDWRIGFGARPPATLADVKRVPAERITHLKLAKRWPSTRGMSIFATVIARLYDVKDLEESERIKNRVLSSWTAAIEKSPDVPGTDLNATSDGQRYLAMAGGTIIDSLAPGEKITGVGPDYPVTGMPEHIADQIRRVASGTGTRFSSISKHYDGNYAAQRQELVESEGHYKIREDQFVAKFVRELYERWLLAAVLDGKITIGRGFDFARAANAEFRGPVTPWIDPLKEVKADIEAINAGLADIDQIRIKRGAPAEMIGQPAPAPVRQPTQLQLVPDDEEDAA